MPARRRAWRGVHRRRGCRRRSRASRARRPVGLDAASGEGRAGHACWGRACWGTRRSPPAFQQVEQTFFSHSRPQTIHPAFSITSAPHGPIPATLPATLKSRKRRSPRRHLRRQCRAETAMHSYSDQRPELASFRNFRRRWTGRRKRSLKLGSFRHFTRRPNWLRSVNIPPCRPARTGVPILPRTAAPPGRAR
jgi:hypothetical protein